MSFLNRFFSALAHRLAPSPRTVKRELYLSKSKYLIGLQCPKALWIHYNDKALISVPHAGTAALFDQGHKVGLLAQKLFPGGIHIDLQTIWLKHLS